MFSLPCLSLGLLKKEPTCSADGFVRRFDVTFVQRSCDLFRNALSVGKQDKVSRDFLSFVSIVVAWSAGLTTV